MTNTITQLFKIKHPIIQGGMVWVSGWKLASAVSNAGGLGLIGAGSMYPEVLREHIQKCKKATNKPFGVNVPMLYPQIDALMNGIEELETLVSANQARTIDSSISGEKRNRSSMEISKKTNCAAFVGGFDV